MGGYVTRMDAERLIKISWTMPEQDLQEILK